MITAEFKGIVKLDKTTINEWYAEDKNGNKIDANFLTEVDQFLEWFDYDPTEEGEEIEIIIKVNRKDEKQ